MVYIFQLLFTFHKYCQLVKGHPSGPLVTTDLVSAAKSFFLFINDNVRISLTMFRLLYNHL